MTLNFEDTIHITPIPDGVSEQEFESEVSRIDGRIDVIEASSDVTDVVGTYSDLENYDTSTLTDNDIIKVLVDSTHGDATSYYRWSTTSETFSFIGSLGPFASEDYVDNNFANQSLSNLSTQGEGRLHALKGYEDAGELLTDTEGLADVKSYAHSTFDASKFTVVGSPDITDDGILTIPTNAYGYAYSTISNDLSTAESWSIKGKFSCSYQYDVKGLISLGTSSNEYFALIFSDKQYRLKIVSSDGNYDTTLNTPVVSLNTTYYYEAGYNSNGYYWKISTDGQTYTTLFENVLQGKKIQACTRLYTGTRIANINGHYLRGGNIDLKETILTVDNAPVFSGNQTGTDTYTIGGNTVTIPYTLSKTGSKIVDSAYRTQVNTVYNEFGYAPYYTLSDTDFTLPMGELYGMIERKMPNTTAIVTISQTDYNNLTVVDSNTLYVITGV